nr:hypothetical protein [uncultured Blautia sp.]
MAKSAFEIQMDYRNAIRQVDSLSEIARELKTTADSGLQDCMSEISGSWTGDNATGYVKKCSLLKDKIIRSSEKLQKTADAIRKIAKNTYDMEMRALEIMQRREY